MRWCFFAGVVLLLISSACKEEINGGNTEEFAELDSIINIMESKLSPLEKEINKLSAFTEKMFQNQEHFIQKADKQRYKISSKGVIYRDNIRPYESGVYVAANTPNREKAFSQLYYTEAMDSLLRRIQTKTPFISQVYFNTNLQMCRIYPSIDVLNVADANLDLTSFNFYYLADEVRNPERKSKWVEEVYIDPAGRGWILSLIHPVYYQEELKGVLGLDITVNDLVQRFLNIKNKKLVIVDASGTVVAGTSSAIETLNLPPLKNHTYIQTINSDSFRKEDFNLFKSKSKEVRRMISKFLLEKDNQFILQDEQIPHKVLCQQMNLLNWYVLQIDQ